MGIVSIGESSEKSSSFYKKFKELANEMTLFSSENKLRVKGRFNCYFIEFEMNGISKLKDINITGERKLSNTKSGLIPVDSVYQEIVNFRIGTHFNHINKFRMEKKGLFRKLIANLKKRKYFEVGKKYFVHSKSEVLIENLKNIKQELIELTDYKLAKFEISDKGIVEIEFHCFFKSNKELSKAMGTITKIINFLS